MAISTTTHLNFRGDARAALEFYREVFGGDLAITTYADFGMPAEAPGATGVVFGKVENDGFRILAYDIPGTLAAADRGTARRENGVTLTDQDFFVAIDGETLDEVAALWERLAVGGTVVESLAASAWSPGFGMVTDRFGVTWILSVVA